MKINRILAIPTLAALLITGCGDSGGPDATATAADSKATLPPVAEKVKTRRGNKQVSVQGLAPADN